MLHRGCGRYPWPPCSPDGPDKVLTDKGMIDLPQHPDLEDQAVFSDDADIEVKRGGNKLACPVCGKLCKSPLGLNSHMRSHK